MITNREIKNNAPEGATHFLNVEAMRVKYYKINGEGIWANFHGGWIDVSSMCTVKTLIADGVLPLCFEPVNWLEVLG